MSSVFPYTLIVIEFIIFLVCSYSAKLITQPFMIKASELQAESANQAAKRQNPNKPQCDEGEHILIFDHCLFYNIVGQGQKHNIGSNL